MASIQINNIPTETYEMILDIQGKKKVEKGCAQYSQAQTVLFMLDDYRKIKGYKKKG